MVEAPKRKRGRPTKAEVEARKAMEEQIAAEETATAPAQEEKLAETAVEVPEAASGKLPKSRQKQHNPRLKSRTPSLTIPTSPISFSSR